MVAGAPRTLPSGATAAAARCPWLTSTATTGCCPQLVQGRRGRRGGLPGRVDVPAATRRVAADVIADRAAGRLGGDLVPAVGEPRPGRQPVAAVRPVRQVGERGGQLDLQPALIRVPADRLVPPRLVLLPVGGQEQPGRFPLPRATGPRSARRRRGCRACAAAPSRPAPPTPSPPSSCRSTRPSRAFSACSRIGLGVPLRGRSHTRASGRLPAGRDRQPGLDPADAGLQAGLAGAQVLLGQPDLVLAGPGDRPGPPRRRVRRQRPLPRRPGPRPAPSRPAAPPRTGRPDPFPASDPRCAPTARSTASSSAVTRSRARTRAPAGAAATNGAATGRRKQSLARPPPQGQPAGNAHIFESNHPTTVPASTCSRCPGHAE